MRRPFLVSFLFAAAALTLGCPANVHQLAANGDLSQLQQEVKRNPAKVNAKDGDGRTPLQAASAGGQAQTVRWLLDNGAQVDLADKDGDTALYYAVRAEHLEICRMLVDAGADPMARNKKGQTPLHIAAYENAELSAYFLALGAPIDVEDDEGEAPLANAVLFGRMEVARLLLEKGADVNHQDKMGKTALFIYLESGAFIQALEGMFTGAGAARFKVEPFEEMINLLVRAGARIDLADNEGLTPLHAAVVSQRCENVSVGSPRPGMTAVALQMGENPDAIRILLGLGAGVNARDHQGRTPLHHAALTNHDQCAKLLIEGGADVNARDNNNQTPLALAQTKPDVNQDVIKVLSAQGGQI